jgi:hypothetical protein
VDVPSKHAVAVFLGPTKGAKPTVYLSDDARALDPRLRQGLTEALGQMLSSRAKLIEPRYSSKLKNAFAAFEFEAGTLPYQALQQVRKARTWFFQSLACAKDQRAERKHRKALRNAVRMETRRERHKIRREYRPLRGATVHFG